MTSELCYLSATDALAAFRARTLSPVELLDAVLTRAQAVEPQVNALTEIRRDRALAAARESEARYGGRGAGPVRPLEGIPVGVKEEQPFAGEPLVQGSLLLAGNVSPVTHPVVERVLAAGGVIHARTATPEFSCAAFTHSRVWGVTRNPWNLGVGAGGSSGGSGASLASGTSVLATGSDIGGSIRIPASFNGVVGYKPPYGRVPDLPPFNLDTYCHNGPMGRSVADVALLQNVLAGQHPLDTVSLPHPGPVSADAAEVRGLRVAWAPTIGDFPVEPEIAAATARAAAALQAQGAAVEQVEIPVSMDLLETAMMAHFGALFGPSIAEVAAGKDDLLTPYARRFRDHADAVYREVGYYGGIEREAQIAAALRPVFERFDIVLIPTVTTLGLAAGDDYTETQAVVDGVAHGAYLRTLLTPLFNVLSRCPVLAVPAGVAYNGVPMGVQLAGQPYAEQSVFTAGAALEVAMGGWWRDPAWRPAIR